MAEKDKAGVVLSLLINVGYLMDKITVEEAGEPKMLMASISTFIEDTDMNPEDICAFIYIVKNSKNEIAIKVHELLNTFSKRYRNAFGDFYHTSKREI